MLDILEKIGAGVCALLVLATLGLYAFLKLPSPKPLAFIPAAKEIAAAPALAPSPGTTTTPVAPEVQNIVDKLTQQGRAVSPSQLTTKTLQVEGELFEHLSAEANLLPALKTAKSRPIPTQNGDTRLQIFNIQKDSILNKLGFQENDVIELVDGQILEFNNNSSTKYYELWNKAKEKLRAGGDVSVTVTRAGRPVNVKFRL